MEPTQDSTDDGATVTAGFENEAFRLRSYQMEMVEESLRGNIVVAMDTGSGKTHIALARTAVELETCDSEMLVWFLTPTVALCEQQSKVFESNLPGYGIQVLSGKDGVDHWTEQSIWDDVLENIRIVMSTYQVLLDALTHGFVKMSKLALIIFDEAHHCTGNSPANFILANFYLTKIEKGDASLLPRILGLSANPVMKAKASNNELRGFEANMNATVKTPIVHRSELLRFVHRPQLLQIHYPIAAPKPSLVLASLEAEFHNYDLMADPYVVELRTKQREGHSVSRQLQKVFTSEDTYCSRQLKTLSAKSNAMSEELGSSAADWYVQQCIGQFRRIAQTSDQQLLDWSIAERQHLLKILRRLPIHQSSSSSSMSLEDISPKVEALLDLLVAEAGQTLTALVFVEQRVWISALAEILTIHPKTRGRFSFGTFVGSSESTKRKADIANFIEPRNQSDTLDKFRSGEINLILTTSVLEEGIDVSSCHLVIDFERPKNLTSFVQRRGRARKHNSKYFIFLPQSINAKAPENWEALEEELRKAYLDDQRQVMEAEQRELLDEEGERFYNIQNTGALLTLQNASQHLHHFCSILGSGAYVDSRPQFAFQELDSGRIVAEVSLPLSVDPAVRTARGLESWATERMAVRDAAFEAYKALHIAGLVNDNLLPARQEASDQAAEFQIPDTTPSLVEASPTMNPWRKVAEQQRQDRKSYHRNLLLFKGVRDEPLQLLLLTPAPMPAIPETTLFWNETKQVFIESLSLTATILSDEETETMRQSTRIILASVFHGRMGNGRSDFLWLLVPGDHHNYGWDHARLQQWVDATSGAQSASELLRLGHHNIQEWGLVSTTGDLRKYIPNDVVMKTSTPFTSSDFHLQATKVPKRRDFLHPVSKSAHTNEAYARVEEFPASNCLVDRLPAVYSKCALFVPSIIYRHEIYMIADDLRTTLLAPLSLDASYLPLILRALSSSAIGEEDNYQRLEFLGDCILKFIASVHLMADNLHWPESFLTGKKGKIVSNGFAARATLSAGLDRFILLKRFTAAKWAPHYTNDIINAHHSEEKIMLSSKTLADVIESLIGMSYLVGGFPTAFICIQTLLPLEKWTLVTEANDVLFDAAPTEVDIPGLVNVEILIGYTFGKKVLLLEALTHASYIGPLANCSYERLEFLGDAVLDYIISERLYVQKPDLSHQTMHSMRTAMANAFFLTFSMFETTISEDQTNISAMEKESHSRYLWQYLRYGSHQLVSARNIAIKQHKAAREQILQALEHDHKFPWHLLSLTDPPKFLSDIVESVIGAIYVDSHGDISSCEIFVRRLGILDCLERILRDRVDCLHPKERLGRLALEKEVRYIKVPDEQEDDMGAAARGYKVQVKIGDEDVGGVVKGLKRLNAETVAAWKAVRIMEGVDDVVMESKEEWFDAEDGINVELEAEVN